MTLRQRLSFSLTHYEQVFFFIFRFCANNTRRMKIIVAVKPHDSRVVRWTCVWLTTAPPPVFTLFLSELGCRFFWAHTHIRQDTRKVNVGLCRMLSCSYIHVSETTAIYSVKKKPPVRTYYMSKNGTSIYRVINTYERHLDL